MLARREDTALVNVPSSEKMHAATQNWFFTLTSLFVGTSVHFSFTNWNILCILAWLERQMLNETKQNDCKKKCPKINKRQIVKTDIVQFISASDHQNDQFSAHNYYRCINTSTLTYINTSYLQWRAVSMVSIILPWLVN